MQIKVRLFGWRSSCEDTGPGYSGSTWIKRNSAIMKKHSILQKSIFIELSEIL